MAIPIRSFLSYIMLGVAIVLALSESALPIWSTEYEAEGAQLHGVSSAADVNASGGYRVRYFDQAEDFIRFQHVAAGKTIIITYSLGDATARECGIYVNGVRRALALFQPTGAWDTYQTLALPLTVGAQGSVKLQLDAADIIFNAGDSCASIDKIAILNQPSGVWRSSLYPSSWTPGYQDSQSRFLHDFSYAGYHNSEADIPTTPPGAVFDVTKSPYRADKTGKDLATTNIQAAIDAAGAAGGGIVYLPAGTYRIKPGAGASYSLRINKNGVVLRGAGPGQTFLFNDETYMRSKVAILVTAPSVSWHSALGGTTINLAKDVGSTPTKTIYLSSVSGLKAGDWIVVRADCTDAFIAEHGMTGLWDSSLQGITFYRRIESVSTSAKTITIDIPTRHYVKLRDNARIYKVAAHLQEAGIEQLSIGNRENLKSGSGENDYDTSGTMAYDAHGSHLIQFSHVVNGWLQYVQTYRPSVNTKDIHSLSNIVLLSKSRNVTVRNCIVQKPLYEGGGGNGYGYTLSGSDCLITDSSAIHTRHNFDFKSIWTSGNVIFRCVTKDGSLVSDFHMHLSPANLLDSMTVDNNHLEAVYRPYGTVIHGHTTVDSVFWNSYGTSRGTNPLVTSRQWGWGYVIGTSGPVNSVTRGTANGTAPEDFLEGQATGATLWPQSLYLDQLQRRLPLPPLEPEIRGKVWHVY
ncbi:MAG: glycosyl hydrolase family 28-related protein [Candidatus Sumerlaeota bacterium]|nr:glycosyl hydrolase family 28-related protein [Candidatus Sumerlaeota bacterium]